MAAPVLYLRGTIGVFSGGSVTFYRPPNVRIFQYNPTIAGYQDRITADAYPGFLSPLIVKPLQFGAGDAAVRLAFNRDIAPTSSPTQFGGGKAMLVAGNAPVVGALSKFAMWPTAQRDPAEFYVFSSTPVTSGGVGNAWTRATALFAVSRGNAQQGVSRIAYVGVGARFASMPAGTKQYLKKVQLERAYNDAGTYPTSYSLARQVQTVVHPDRLNYSPNPGFAVDTTNYSASAGGTLTRVAFGAGFAGQTAITSNSAVTISHTLSGLVVGRRYTASILVAADQRPDVVVGVATGTRIARLNYANAPADPFGLQTRRVYVVFDALATTETITLAPTAVTATPNVLATQALIEVGDVLRPYFDGSSGADYLWETGGTAGKARSYYYKNRAERLAALKRILADNVPMGIGIADPQMAVLPVE